MRRASPDTDQVIRSFLQKAVRRGVEEYTDKAARYIIEINEFQWLRKRLAVMIFEECWPHGITASFANDEQAILSQYLELQSLEKNKDAAGLGALAYALSTGDGSVLNGEPSDKHIRVIEKAIKRPKDFWSWVHALPKDTETTELVRNADKGFRKSGWPWDRAFSQAAAYLAVTEGIPSVNSTEPSKADSLPLWVGIDKHTKKGKAAIRQAAKEAGVKSNEALWLSFYFESATCNSLRHSPWWERERAWRLDKLGLSESEAQERWKMLSPRVETLLCEESIRLKKKLESIANSNSLEQESKQTSLFS